MSWPFVGWRPEEDPLPEALKRQRQQLGVGQKTLARAAGIGHNAIGMIERREVCPTKRTVSKIAAALTLTPGQLDPWFEKRRAT